MTVDTSPWKCEACGRIIEVGVVVVFNANPSLGRVGSYPIHASPDFQPGAHTDAHLVARDQSVATPDEARSLEVDDAVWETLDRPVNIGVAAYCAGCVPADRTNAYSMPARPSAAGWLSWLAHLHQKRWMGSWDLHRLNCYWFHNRGIVIGGFLA